jgi:hypothetical protein
MSACATLAIEAPPLKSLGVVKAVESDQAGKAGEAPVHPRGHRIVPVEIDVAERACRHDEIGRPLTEDLVSDPRFAQQRVSRLGNHALVSLA